MTCPISPHAIIRRGIISRACVCNPRAVIFLPLHFHHEHHLSAVQPQPQPYQQRQRRHLNISSRSLFSSSMATETGNGTSGPAISFSVGEDPSALQERLHPLLATDGEGGKWQLTAANNGLERSFKFKTFKKTWEFMNAVAAECAVKKHHPEWSNVYNTTFIRWTTHSPPGLSSKDAHMAQFCDEQARVFGELDVEQSADKGRDLADTVAQVGGDCCLPKSKPKSDGVKASS